MKAFRGITLILILCFLTACNQLESSEFRDISSVNRAEELPNDDTLKDPNLNTPPALGQPEIDINICSDLDLSLVQWPIDFTTSEANAMALALNITGSFEGLSGWDNISNNFDGQGLSLGLFNQNLGQGSLQPLLIKFAQTYPNEVSKYFSSLQIQSLRKMLEAWGNSRISSQKLSTQSTPHVQKLVVTQASNNIDKIYKVIPEGGEFQSFKLSDKNQASVDWAIDNLYEDKAARNFKPEWKNSFKNLARSPEYQSLQIEAARPLHEKALGYMETYGFSELRSYLFFFDIAVQNGSLRDIHKTRYFDYLDENPQDSITENLLNLMEIRAASSRAEFRDDVRSRKRTIILGEGVVHRSQRDLPQEYCYAPLDNINRGSLAPILSSLSSRI